MPNYLIIATDSERPKLWLSQQPLQEVIRSCSSWPYSHIKRMWVHEIRVIPSPTPGGDPTNAAELALVAKLEPVNSIDHFFNLAVLALDELPAEQVLELVPKLADSLDYHRLQAESKLKGLVK